MHEGAAREQPTTTVHGNPLPWILSLLLHGALAVVLLILPAQANQPRLQTLELVDRPPPPPPLEPKTEPPPPLPRVVAMERVRRPQRAEPPPPPVEPVEPTPPRPSPPQTAPPPSFGLKLSGTATAAPGQGVQVPEGDTLRTSPGQRRPKDSKKGEPTRGPAGRPGFRKVYGKGDNAPLAVATTMPTLLKKEIPPYPEKAKELGIEGRVVLEVTVNGDGKVIAVRVVTSLHPLLDAAATKAARKMRFAPGTVNGTPVTLKIPVPFTFVLD